MPPPPKVATNFQEILEQIWWRLDTALDLDMIRWSAMLGALESLENGTTAIVDHHESPNAIEGSLDVIAEACAEVGVRVLTTYGITIDDIRNNTWEDKITGALPRPYLTTPHWVRARWLKYVAQRKLGHHREADQLLDLLAGERGEIGVWARQELASYR